MSETCDVIVVGGGPGGSSAATFVAMQGHRVVLLEKERFPVYKIGESLLPSTVNGICVMLGVSEQLKTANFVRKRGGVFRWGRAREPWTFQFSNSSRMPGPTAFAYQVERMKFDSILLDNARSKGVDVREEHSVIDAIMDDDGRVCGLSYKTNDGARKELRSKYVIDASGWTTRLASHVGTRIYSQFFRNIAIFGYYLNGERLPPPSEGNIFCAAFERGWFWYIPLSDTLTSVGAVIGEEFGDILKSDSVAAYEELIRGCAPIAKLLRGATRVTEGPYGEVRVRKDFSYCHSAFSRPGLLLVGDAACFIDPVFSSGVHLATYSALLAARSVNTCLAGDVDEPRAMAEFQYRYLREFRAFYDFLVAFYDTDQHLESYYWEARRVLGSNERGNEPFLQLVGGIGGSGERLFDSPESFLTYQAKLAADISPAAGAAGAKPTAAGIEFMGALLRESAQLQMHALQIKGLGHFPLIEGGLIPSSDGFHWAVPA